MKFYKPTKPLSDKTVEDIARSERIAQHLELLSKARQGSIHSLPYLNKLLLECPCGSDRTSVGNLLYGGNKCPKCKQPLMKNIHYLSLSFMRRVCPADSVAVEDLVILFRELERFPNV